MALNQSTFIYICRFEIVKLNDNAWLMLSTTSDIRGHIYAIHQFICSKLRHYYNLSITMQIELVIHWTEFPCAWIIMIGKSTFVSIWTSYIKWKTISLFVNFFSQFFDAKETHIQPSTLFDLLSFIFFNRFIIVYRYTGLTKKNAFC